MKEVKFLEIDEVLAIHEEIINTFGGRMPVHNFTLLHSAISRSKATFEGKDLYKSIFDKAAVLIHSLILNHPFDDGNKRTAISSCPRFLYINGWNLQLPRQESIQLTLDIAAKQITLEEVSFWLKKHSQNENH